MNKLLILILFSPFFGFGQFNQSLPDKEQNKLYSRAISDYIKAVQKKHPIRFDSLFFGKHDQFPNIKLPETIDGLKIKLISVEEGTRLQKERPKTYFINMIGWDTKTTHEFMLVTFTNHNAHQFDCFITYTYNPKQGKFELSKLRFEYFGYK